MPVCHHRYLLLVMVCRLVTDDYEKFIPTVGSFDSYGYYFLLLLK